MSAWLLLSLSILSEVIGNIQLRISDGLSKLTPSAIMAVCYILAIWLMGLAMKRIGMSVTYAVWAGVGTMLTTIAGVFLFNETFSLIRVVAMISIIAGVVLLHLDSPSV